VKENRQVRAVWIIDTWEGETGLRALIIIIITILLQENPVSIFRFAGKKFLQNVAENLPD
jgi:hypothetical protein